MTISVRVKGKECAELSGSYWAHQTLYLGQQKVRLDQIGIKFRSNRKLSKWI